MRNLFLTVFTLILAMVFIAIGVSFALSVFSFRLLSGFVVPHVDWGRIVGGVAFAVVGVAILENTLQRIWLSWMRIRNGDPVGKYISFQYKLERRGLWWAAKLWRFIFDL